jgi:hypothetical protein
MAALRVTRDKTENQPLITLQCQLCNSRQQKDMLQYGMMQRQACCDEVTHNT